MTLRDLSRLDLKRKQYRVILYLAEPGRRPSRNSARPSGFQEGLGLPGPLPPGRGGAWWRRKEAGTA
jgi:hypothetical protein